MSKFQVLVRKIVDPVINHFDADRLVIVQIDGFKAISAKLEDGTSRYNAGDHVVYIPEASVVPDWLLQKLGFWNDETSTGMLDGNKRNIVKARRLRGIYSQGILLPVQFDENNQQLTIQVPIILDGRICGEIDILVTDGKDVASVLGIIKWEAPIPSSMAGDVVNIGQDVVKRYDFENYQKVGNIFDEGEEVIASEKIHGTHFSVGFVNNLKNEEIFGQGDIYVASKGLGSQGLVFKNVSTNDRNLYVQALTGLLNNGFESMVRQLSSEYSDAPVRIFGEIFGKGVQDLAYGFDKPVVRIFDIAIGENFLSYDQFATVAQRLNIDCVPILYRGPFTKDVLESHRDGLTTFGGANVLEGIVIKTVQEGHHWHHGRKIAKMISPNYTLRKAKKGVEITEHN